MPAAAPDPDAVAALARGLAEAISADDTTAADVAAAAGGDVQDDGAPLGLRTTPDIAGVQAVTVTRKWDSEEPNAAEIQLSAGLTLAQIEERLGPSSSLPSMAPGSHVVVLETEGSPATIFAALDGDGAVHSLTVRRDN